MDAEIIFFMSQKDQTDFLTFAKTNIDKIDKSKIPYRLNIGDCELFLTPSQRDENEMITGKLEIRLGTPDKTCQNHELAKSTFRKLRSYLKKNYSSRLAYLNENKKNQLTPSRNHWLGPDAKKWKEGNPKKHILKLSKTSWMTFEIGI